MPTVFGEALDWLRTHLVDGGGTLDGTTDDHVGGRAATPAPSPVRAWFGVAGSGVSTRRSGRGARAPRDGNNAGAAPAGAGASAPASRAAGWRDLADWPPPGTGRGEWRLSGDRTLLGPGTPAGPAGPAVTAFRYDPRDPTPSVGGISMGSNGSGAQRNDSLEARPDVVTFTGAPLGAVLEVAGPVSVRLRVRGSTPYFDVFARLCDVDPAGHSWNVCDGIRRLGESGAGQGGAADGSGWVEITVPMSSAAHRFGAGHRVRLQLSGGAHPRFARNTGTGEPIATATAASLVAVDIDISHDPAGPGGLLLPTVTR
jgi:hypothetical protein